MLLSHFELGSVHVQYYYYYVITTQGLPIMRVLSIWFTMYGSSLS
jgi:hypothetical protein